MWRLVVRPVDDGQFPTVFSSGPHESDLHTLVQAIKRYAISLRQRVNLVLPKDGTEAMTAPIKLAEYTVATRPTASDWEGAIIYVSDGAAGAKFQGSDGASWVNLG